MEEINQQKLKDSILTKDVNVWSDELGLDVVQQTPYNDALRAIDHKLGSYKYDQLELRLLQQEIWNATPEWYKKKMVAL